MKISYDRANLSDEKLKMLYYNMLFSRLTEEKMLNLLRQGKVTKWFSGIGQEAISAGVTAALTPEEYIFPMHRNLGVFLSRGIPLSKLIRQWQGEKDGFTKGRDRSFHFGAPEYKIIGMISHLGPQLSMADGVALAHKLKGEKKAALAFTGEGGTSEGEFHEALNVAAVWDLPVIFLIENNGYGLSTPITEQYRCNSLSERGVGYGIKSFTIEGNNILEVYNTIQHCASEARNNPRPFLVECKTFRMRGHEEASGIKYVPDELLEHWQALDPVTNFRDYLISNNIMEDSEEAEMRQKLQNQIRQVIDETMQDQAESPPADPEKEKADVYAPVNITPSPPSADVRDLRFIDAISEGLDEAMQKFPDLVLMGQDIAEYGGVFKITEGFVEKYGRHRVRNTPLCESAILGTGIGLSLEGIPSMVEMQFADFVSCGMTQIANNMAKLHYRWGESVNITIRMPTGAGMGAGPFHSQSNESWFTHIPGLKIVYPATPEDAKGLMIRSFEDPNPVMFFEHKFLYRMARGEVASGYYSLPFGKAQIKRKGTNLSIITYGMGVHWAIKYCEEKEIDAEIIDLRTLIPVDEEEIFRSVKKTHRALLLHEDTLTGGFGGELQSRINEKCFEYLDAPVLRCGSLDTPVPFATHLEKQFLANSRLDTFVQKILNY